MRSSGAKSESTRRQCSSLWLRRGNALAITHSSNLLSGALSNRASLFAGKPPVATGPQIVFPSGTSAPNHLEDDRRTEARLNVDFSPLHCGDSLALWGCYATAVQALATK